MFLKILFSFIILDFLEVYSDTTKNLKVFRRDDSGHSKNCFGNLGCLETTPEWFHNTFRPRNLEPLERHTIRTEFILITKDSDQTKPLIYETMTMRQDAVLMNGYCKNKGLVIFIHDFTSNGYTGWVKHIATALITKLSSNMISVDWEAGAEPPFEQAIANARIVALEIRAFLNMLKNTSSLHTEHVHIIGHGVGAHIAGYVGTYMSIGKITGLDPTGPFFEQMPNIVRLDPGDAKYVEVLHTDAFNSRSQGSQKALGHADFYINGAKMQPLCNQSSKYPVFTKIDRNILKEGVILPACSHKRSFKYYIEALDNVDCEFTGIGCKSYEEFAEGKCTTCGSSNHTNCATFDMNSTAPLSSNHNFYVNTRGEAPYCMNSYKVEMHFENNPNAKKHQEGTFEIIMIDEQGIMANGSMNYIGVKTTMHTFNSGKIHTFIYYATPPRMDSIVELRLKWTHNPNSLCVVFCNRSVYVNKIVIQLLSAKQNSHCENHLCPAQTKTEIENGSSVLFTRCSETSSVAQKKPRAKPNR